MMILHLFKIIYFVTETKMNHPLRETYLKFTNIKMLTESNKHTFLSLAYEK